MSFARPAKEPGRRDDQGRIDADPAMMRAGERIMDRNTPTDLASITSGVTAAGHSDDAPHVL